jgi:hypothetical protein
MKDICTEFPKIPEIRVKMNRRVNDEEVASKSWSWRLTLNNFFNSCFGSKKTMKT